MTRLAQRIFTITDLGAFSAASSDWNPWHVDHIRARRTQAGAPVVHGIHLLLWALESLADSLPDLPAFHGLQVHFNKFVFLDESVELLLVKQTSSSARMHILVDNGLRLRVNVEFGDRFQSSAPSIDPAVKPQPLLSVPLELRFQEIDGRSGSFPFPMCEDDAVSMFPAAAKWMGVVRVRALAASTYLVGMVCPGLHSIYSDLSVNACDVDRTQNVLAFRVTETDPRFNAVEQEILGGGISGVVRSFLRQPPLRQASMNALKSVVAPGEFSGAVVLVVGGSRGLGELTAKLIATGGGRVILTWQSGKEDAEHVANEIRSVGGVCDTVEYDVRTPAARQLTALPAIPTHMYYFATCTIFRPQGEFFSIGRLREFLAFYVDGFWQLLHGLRAMQPGISAFYPSSISVTKRPRGMTEYSMAKAAGEVLCADMNETLAPLYITVRRLPRLPTDQTAAVTAVEVADPVETMLPIIREVQLRR